MLQYRMSTSGRLRTSAGGRFEPAATCLVNEILGLFVRKRRKLLQAAILFEQPLFQRNFLDAPNG